MNVMVPHAIVPGVLWRGMWCVALALAQLCFIEKQHHVCAHCTFSRREYGYSPNSKDYMFNVSRRSKDDAVFEDHRRIKARGGEESSTRWSTTFKDDRASTGTTSSLDMELHDRHSQDAKCDITDASSYVPTHRNDASYQVQGASTMTLGSECVASPSSFNDQQNTSRDTSNAYSFKYNSRGESLHGDQVECTPDKNAGNSRMYGNSVSSIDTKYSGADLEGLYDHSVVKDRRFFRQIEEVSNRVSRHSKFNTSSDHHRDHHRDYHRSHHRDYHHHDHHYRRDYQEHYRHRDHSLSTSNHRRDHHRDHHRDHYQSFSRDSYGVKKSYDRHLSPSIHHVSSSSKLSPEISLKKPVHRITMSSAKDDFTKEDRVNNSSDYKRRSLAQSSDDYEHQQSKRRVFDEPTTDKPPADFNDADDDPVQLKLKIASAIESNIEMISSVENDQQRLIQEKNRILSEIEQQSSIHLYSFKAVESALKCQLASERGKLNFFGFSFDPSIIALPSDIFIKAVYCRNRRVARASRALIGAQLDFSEPSRTLLKPYLNYIKNSNRHMHYVRVAKNNAYKLALLSANSKLDSKCPSLKIENDMPLSVDDVCKNDVSLSVDSVCKNDMPLASSEPMEMEDLYDKQVIESYVGQHRRSVLCRGIDFQDFDNIPDMDFDLGDENCFPGDGDYPDGDFEDSPAENNFCQYEFLGSNIELHRSIGGRMLEILLARRRCTAKMIQALLTKYRKSKLQWSIKLRIQREEEASYRFLQNKRCLDLAQHGRRFPTRSSRSDEKVKHRNAHVTEAYSDDFDQKRFEQNEAVIPPMIVFDVDYQWKKYSMVCNNGFQEEPVKVDLNYHIDRYWYPQEEAVFVQCYAKYYKNFEQISKLFFDKPLSEVIRFYYRNKNRLRLKETTKQIEKPPVISETTAVTNTCPSNCHYVNRVGDPDETEVLYCGSAVEWVNGAGRRGSVRLSSKVHINYSEKERGNVSKIASNLHNMRNQNSKENGIVNVYSGTANSTVCTGVNANNECLEKQSNSTADAVPSVKDSNFEGATFGGKCAETSTRWSQREKERFIELYAVHEKDFVLIAEAMKTKNSAQCKNYFHNNKQAVIQSLNESHLSGKSSSRKKSNSVKKIAITDDSMTVESNEICAHVDKDELAHVVKLEQAVGQPDTIKTEQLLEIENESAVDGTDDLEWNSEENEQFQRCLSIYGKNWKAISRFISSKSVKQIKDYYQTHKSKFYKLLAKETICDPEASKDGILIDCKNDDISLDKSEDLSKKNQHLDDTSANNEFPPSQNTNQTPRVIGVSTRRSYHKQLEEEAAAKLLFNNSSIVCSSPPSLLPTSFYKKNHSNNNTLISIEEKIT